MKHQTATQRPMGHTDLNHGVGVGGFECQSRKPEVKSIPDTENLWDLIMQTDNVTGMVILCFKRFYFQRGRQGGEGNINVRLPLMHTPQWTQPATQARALTGNGTSDPLVHSPALNPLSHTSQGRNCFIRIYLLPKVTELVFRPFSKVHLNCQG